MKHIVIGLMLTYCFSAYAQTWCPPGAIWKHNMYGFQCNGYSELNYVGDSIIQGKTCKKINHRFLGYNAMFATTGTVNVSLTNHFSYENNKVVYYFNSNSQFDTLYNFNANIGDKWLRILHPNAAMCTPQRREVEVLDTGHVTINSTNLRKIVLKYTSVFMATYTTTVIDTVYEKIGSKKNFLFPFVCEGAIIDPDLLAGGAFRCYSDNVFGNYNLVSNCNYILSVETKVKEKDSCLLFPNPASKKINISCSDASCKVSIYDTQGNLCKINLNTNLIDVSELPPGLYYLQIEKLNGVRVSRKFVKE